MSKIWTVRGVSDDIQRRASEAAASSGMRLGPWVERAVLAALEGSGRVRSKPAGDPIVTQIAELQDRVARLEAQTSAAPAASVTGDAVESDGEADAAETDQDTEPDTGRARQVRRKWTTDDDAVLRRIFERGGTQADACQELGRPESVISIKWREAGLPVPPRKGRKLTRRSD
jgi:hypothetical protein